MPKDNIHCKKKLYYIEWALPARIAVIPSFDLPWAGGPFLRRYKQCLGVYYRIKAQ